MNYQANNILVTGGAGFIGSNFIRYLLENNRPVKIVNLDALTYAGNKANLTNLKNPKQHQLIEGNICDRQLIEKLLREHHIDTIIHFAAESHVDRSISGPEAFIQTNIVGTFCLLEAARQYWLEEKKLSQQQCRFHHISTDEVYGSLEEKDPAFSETTAYDPSSPYSAAKAGSDHLAKAYFRTYGLPMTITNCSNNYGPYQHQEKLIPTIIKACIHQQPIPIYGDGKNIRDWLFVDDHCSAIETVITKGKLGETYNIGGECELTNLEVASTICKTMDALYPQKNSHLELIQFVKDRPGHDKRYAININKIKSELNWQPQENFASGIKKTITYYT